jgi:hypothetical protein
VLHGTAGREIQLPCRDGRSAIAFSSEVGAGSREENASKQEVKPGSDSIRTEQALGDKFKGIAVAPDAAGVEMSANDQCRRIGEPREQFAPRRAG